MANKASHPLLSDKLKQKDFSGYWVGINGADPATYKLPRGVTLVRAGEGVWTLTLPKSVAVVESARFQANDTGEFHEVTHTRSGRVFTVTHKTCAWASIASGPAAEDVVDEIHFSIKVQLISSY